MKKPRPQAPPLRKHVLRREAIAPLTRAQLDHVVGGDDGDCSAFRPQSCMHSNAIDASCVTAD